MRVYDMLRRKRDGEELSEKEIRYLIGEYVAGRLPDYQMSAFLMAVYFQGMTDAEILALTQVMIESGDQLSLTDIPGVIVDKHSTGGVGDKTTLVLVPLIAAAGVPVVKMSGRGLGHTGGTLDKLDSLTGFHTELTLEDMIRSVQTTGACIAGQTGNLTPADKKLYALRDVTATVESIPLIAASVMSKKLAAGAEAIVLDVKCGQGAFMKDLEQAERLAETMVAIAEGAGKKAIALVTSMEQPLGYAVGNTLEVKEAIATLRNDGPQDLVDLVIALGAQMLRLSGRVTDDDEAAALLRHLLDSGAGLQKFREMVVAQGGDGAFVDDPSLLQQAPHVQHIRAHATGFIQEIDAFGIGTVAMSLGAGRHVQGASIDLSVGIELTVKVGDHVKQGQTIGRVHAASKEDANVAIQHIEQALCIGDSAPVLDPLILRRVPPS